MPKKSREYISKKIREQVYNKFDGHCAYCGKKIEYKEMQLDHFIPYKLANNKNYNKEDIINEQNYFPSCRLCN